MASSLKVLFLPVSSEKGLGEFQRSLTIANALATEFEAVDITFGLNKCLQGLVDCPYQVYPLPNTPTRCTREVKEVVRQTQPHIVIFDASGRKAQLAFCHSKGIKTLFIAQHSKKLRKGMSWGRLKNSDAIVVVQPPHFMPPLSPWQKLKLRLLDKPQPKYIGPIVPVEEHCFTEENDIAGFDMDKPFLFFSAGGGGNRVGVNDEAGERVFASDIFLQAARSLSETLSIQILVILGPNYRQGHVKNALLSDARKNIYIVRNVSGGLYSRLLRTAQLCVLSGGSNLMQAISLGQKNIVAVPVASDQGGRIEIARRFHGVVTCKPEQGEIQKWVLQTLDSNSHCDNGAESHQVANGLQSVVDLIKSLVDVKA